MSSIHPLACVDSKAELGSGCVVEPFAVVEAGVVMGSQCVISAHAVVRSGTTMGDRNRIGNGAVIGGDPQDRKYKDEPTFLRIGNDNVIREYVTLHRATGEGKATVVGNNNYLMANMHLGHNGRIGDWVTIANSCDIGGHVTIEDGVNMGGVCAIHQYVRIGKYSMIGGMSGISTDVPPFMLTEGRRARVYDINAIGLRRLGVSSEVRRALHKACKILYRSELTMSKAIQRVREEVPSYEEVNYLLAFLENIGTGRFGRQDQK